MKDLFSPQPVANNLYTIKIGFTQEQVEILGKLLPDRTPIDEFICKLAMLGAKVEIDKLKAKEPADDK